MADRPDAAPAVVALVHTSDPSPDRWEAVVAGLADQAYPALSVVVVHSGPPAAAAALAESVRHLPAARVAWARGPAAVALNHVVACLPDHERAGYLLLCHDDAALAPGAVAALVEAAERWGAAIVGPKLLAWDQPRQLLDVGRAVDRLGTTLPYVEQGEIDQAQHDGLHEVFSVPGAAMLVRAERFVEVGGFDEAIDGPAADLSLCWRARVAGARVLVTTAARARHAEDCPSAAGAGYDRRLGRHRLRAMLSGYTLLGLVRVVPVALAMTLAEALGALATGRGRRARAAVGAWPWNAARLATLVRLRRRLHACRRVRDGAIREAQVHGVIGPRLRLRRLRRSRGAVDVARGRAPVESGSAWTPSSTAVALVLAAVLLFGSRHLITRGVPAVGEMVPLGGSPGDLVAQWSSGWRDVGLGAEAPGPTLLAALGLLGGLLGGAMGLARTVAVVGLLPLGVVGAHRLLGPSGSKAAQLAAAVGYAAVPLPYNAFAAGRWTSLAAYAAAPWLLARLARATGVAPFAPPVDDGEGPGTAVGTLPPGATTDADTSAAGIAADPPGAGPGVAAGGAGVAIAHPLRRHVVATGAVTGLAALLVPQAPALLLGMASALAVGSLLAGQPRGTLRLLAAAVGGAVVGALLHLPAAVEVGRSWAAVEAWAAGGWSADGLAPLEALRFQTGELGTAPFGYALVGAAALPLLVGRGWRLAWAIRGWTLAVVAWGVAWAGHEGWVEVALPHDEVVLAPAAAGMALAVGAGVAALGADVRGRSWRLGFRRLAAGSALVALAGATLPVLSAVLDGWWDMPRGDFTGVLSQADRTASPGGSRVLWLGDPEALPGGGSWVLDDGTHFATSTGPVRTAGDLWPGPEDDGARRIAAALDLAASGRTHRLGRLLAPFAVDLLVVPERAAPSPSEAPAARVPEGLVDVLAEQLDLERLDVDSSLVAYRNTAAAPLRSVTRDPAVLTESSVEGMAHVDLTGTDGVLAADPGRFAADGPVPGGSTVVLAVADGERWQLEVAGERAGRGDAFGWASAYPVDRGGRAELRYAPSPAHRALIATQVLLWLAAGVAALRMRVATAPVPGARRRRRGGSGADDGARPLRPSVPARDDRPTEATVAARPAGPGRSGGEDTTEGERVPAVVGTAGDGYRGRGRGVGR